MCKVVAATSNSAPGSIVLPHTPSSNKPTDLPHHAWQLNYRVMNFIIQKVLKVFIKPLQLYVKVYRLLTVNVQKGAERLPSSKA